MSLKSLARYLLLVAFTFLLGFSYNYHLPKIESFILVELENFSATHLPVRIWARKLNFHLLPLGVVLEDVKVLARPPLDKYLAPADLREVGARVALWPLLRGEVRLSQIFLRDSELNVFLRNELFQGSKKSPALKFDFDKLYGLPIDEIVLEQVQLQGRLDPQNVVFRISDLNLLLENRYQSIFVEINAPRVLVKPSGTAKPLNVQLELRTLIEAQEMQVSAFKLKADDSFVVASGRFNGDFTVGRVDNGAFDARTKLRLSDLNVWEQIFSLSPKLPLLTGKAEADASVEVRKDKGYNLEADVKTQDVTVANFIVGNIESHIRAEPKTVTCESLHVENSAGKVDFSAVHLTLDPQPKIELQVKIPGLEVKQLLENLKVHHVPILIPVSGEARCQGEWNENPELNCSAQIAASHAHVDSGGTKNMPIIDVDEFRASGDVKITKHQVEYKGDAQAGKNTSGHSQGVINYDTGFSINFQGDKVDLNDVKKIANLKIEGLLKLSGNTTGTAHWATLDTTAEGENIWLEDYPLGRLSARAGYKAGILSFTGVSGQYEVSRYNGSVSVDLPKSQIRINGQLPFMDLKDIQSVFQRKVTLPISANGTGTGKIEAHGPLRFQDLTYDVRSSFYRGQIAEESFDELIFQVHAKNGFVKSDKINLTKASGAVEVKGQVTPQGEIDTVAIGRGLRLEQSENVLALGLDLQGLADFTVLIRGQLPHPRIELNGRLSKMVLADQAAEDSVFKLNFLRDRTEGSGRFLGSTVVSNFILPYDGSAPFLLDVKTRKWDFTTLFSTVSRSAKQIDFNTSLTMDMKIQSARGGFWESSGEAKIDEMIVRKGSKNLSAQKPMRLIMRQGVINSEDFALTSGENYLKMDVAGLSKNHLNASLNGKVDLSLLGLFTPFISDLRGGLSLSMDLQGTAEKPTLSGTAYIDRGYAKFEDFYHPFSNFRADVVFNNNEVLANSISSDIAGGKLSGDGKISFKGNGLRTVNAKANFSDVKINIPEGYRTRGSGTVAIHGDKFPYLMDINYDVSGGDVLAEFTDKKSDTSVKASSFLPHFIEKDAFHPFNFNIYGDLKNPISVNNALLAAPVTGQLRITGSPDRLTFNGTLTAQPGGKVFFGDQPFEIVSAYAEYTGQAPNDPKIYVSADARVTETVVDEQNRSTQNQYEVSMLVQGRGQAPQINLTSQPPLGQREIVSLLALGTTGTLTNADERKTSVVEAANPSAAIGSVVLDKAGAKKVKEALGVDVKVSTAPPLTTGTGGESSASSPKVTLSKQWTPKLGASASSTVEAVPNNNVKLEYKMNKNISVIGSWDGRETLHDQQQNTARNVLGLDLQYKMQFK